MHLQLTNAVFPFLSDAFPSYTQKQYLLFLNPPYGLAEGYRSNVIELLCNIKFVNKCNKECEIGITAMTNGLRLHVFGYSRKLNNFLAKLYQLPRERSVWLNLQPLLFCRNFVGFYFFYNAHFGPVEFKTKTLRLAATRNINLVSPGIDRGADGPSFPILCYPINIASPDMNRKHTIRIQLDFILVEILNPDFVFENDIVLNITHWSKAHKRYWQRGNQSYIETPPTNLIFPLSTSYNIKKGLISLSSSGEIQTAQSIHNLLDQYIAQEDNFEFRRKSIVCCSCCLASSYWVPNPNFRIWAWHYVTYPVDLSSHWQ